MRKLLGLCSLAIVSLPLTAAAQPPPPPPPPGGAYSTAPEEPKMRLEIGLSGNLPQGDWDEDAVDTSPGLGLEFHFTVAPNFSIYGGLRAIAIQISEDSNVDLTHYDFQGGGRYAFPVSPTMKIFGQAHIGYATLSAEADGESESESGLQFGGKAGGLFSLGGRTSIGGAIGFTTADIDISGLGEIEDAWLGIEGFVSIGF